MKKLILSFVVLMCIPFIGYNQSVAVGSKAPEMQNIEWIGGKSLTDTKKPMFIDFFATWCGPCRKVMPHLESLAKEYEGKIYFVVLSNENISKMEEFFGKTNNKPFFIGVDKSGGMFKSYSVTQIPHGVLIDKTGKVVWIGNSAALTKELLNGVVKK